MNKRLITALLATATLAAGQAHAFGELPPFATDAGPAGTLTRAEVRADAVRAERQGQVVTGEAGTTAQAAAPAGARTRADVRAEAITSASAGHVQEAEMAF